LGSRVVVTLVVVVLLSACDSPPVQRPLEGAPARAAGAATDKESSAAPTIPPVPPTLSPSGPSTANTPEQPAASAPSPSPAPIPGFVIVATDGRGANLRDGPSTSAPVIVTLPEGAAVEVLGDPVTVDGRAWRRVRSGNREGWVVSVVVRPR
jgi:hypothetical protein